MSLASAHLNPTGDGETDRPATRRSHRWATARRTLSHEVRRPVPAAAGNAVLADEPNVVRELPPLPSAVDRTTADPAHLPGAKAQPRVSVIVPTYNEGKNLPYVFSRLPEDLHEVILVDGHSMDGTVEIARALRSDVRVVLQNRRGKGNAMACGFAAATGDVIVMLDADGSADPDEIPLFVAALTNGADFAKGSRFAHGGGSTDITQVRAWGNRWLNRLANVLFGTQYSDLCYGYNAFWTYCLDSLELDPRPELAGGKLWGDGFEIETIINTRMAKCGMRIAEVPSFEHPRVHGESNLNTWRDGVRVLRALVVERCNGKARYRRAHRPTPSEVVHKGNVVAPAPGNDTRQVLSA